MKLLLIHGLGRTWWSMRYIGWSLARRGYTVEYLAHPSTSSSLDELVAFTIHRIRALRRLTNRDDEAQGFGFVGHSLGGILLRCAAQEAPELFTASPEHGVQLSRIVMLGSPNNSAAIARLLSQYAVFRRLFGPVLTELGTLSLQHNHRFHKTTGVIAGGRGNSRGYNPLFGEDNDLIVTVRETILSPESPHITIPVTHAGMLISRTVVRHIDSFMLRGSFSDH